MRGNWYSGFNYGNGGALITLLSEVTKLISEIQSAFVNFKEQKMEKTSWEFYILLPEQKAKQKGKSVLFKTGDGVLNRKDTPMPYS